MLCTASPGTTTFLRWNSMWSMPSLWATSAMIAVGAGGGNHAELNRRERAILLRARLDVRLHGMPRNAGNEFLFAGEFPFHRAARFQHRKHAQLFAKHLLLAAKSPTDPLG